MVDNSPPERSAWFKVISGGENNGIFEAIQVSSLSKALALIEREAFDVILLDLTLPDSLGTNTFSQLYSRVPEVPIVVTTIREDSDQALKLLREGAQDYLVKGEIDAPFLKRSLLYAIERHRTQVMLQHLSFNDDLTGLLNRRGFISLAEQQLKIAQREVWELVLLFPDLDGLKNINDNLGHPEGDRALRTVATLLRETFRTSDLGDELWSRVSLRMARHDDRSARAGACLPGGGVWSRLGARGPVGRSGLRRGLFSQPSAVPEVVASEPWMKVRRLPTRTLWKPFSTAILNGLRQAQSYIYVENPYLLDKRVILGLVHARNRGVEVRVIIPRVNDLKAAGRASLVVANYLLQHGVRVYFYPGMTHVKAVMIDGWVCVGSSNLNHLSLRVNQEQNIATSDPRFAEEVKRDLFDKDFSRSHELTEPISIDWMDILANLLLEGI